MKKISITLLFVALSSTTAFAMDTVNFSKSDYTCNKIQITPQTTQDNLVAYCNNVTVVVRDEVTGGRNNSRVPGGGAEITQNYSSDAKDAILDKVKFYADDGSYMICYYQNAGMVKCKVSPPKTASHSKVSSSGSL